MAPPIPDALRPRLGRFVRLLASDQPGEVVAAATALRRALAGVGADLHDLADAIERPAEPITVFSDSSTPRRPRASRRPKHDDIVLDAASRRRIGEALWRAMARGSLSEWETEFTASVTEQMQTGCGRITRKQGDALERLLARLGEGAAWV